MFALYLWTYASSVVALLLFLGAAGCAKPAGIRHVGHDYLERPRRADMDDIARADRDQARATGARAAGARANGARAAPGPA